MQCMWQKAGEQNKRQQSPLARAAHPVKTRRPTGFRLLPSVDLLRKMVACEWVGSRASQRRMGAMWSGGRRKATSIRCNSCSLVFFQKMWNWVDDDESLDLAHDEDLWSNVLGMKIHFDTMHLDGSSKIYFSYDPRGFFWTNVKLSHMTLELTLNRLKVNPLILILSPYLPCFLNFGK